MEGSVAPEAKENKIMRPEALQPISWLEGVWVTENGQGYYPTITSFSYTEEMEFTCLGQPMLNYTSTTRHREKKTPMHQERGFLRIKPNTNTLAFIISHNFGLTSLEEGVCDTGKKEIKLESKDITRMSFAKAPQVLSIKRVLKLIDENTLEQTISMATERTLMTEHLKAVYKRKQRS